MGQASTLPIWVNLVWMSISGITLLGAIIWTLFIFWPMLRETKRMQIEGLALGKSSNDTLSDLVKKLDPLVERGERAMKSLEKMLGKFEKQDFEKVESILSRIDKEMNGGGQLERLVKSVERIANKADGKADDIIDGILEDAWEEEPAVEDPADPGVREGIDDKPRS